MNLQMVTCPKCGAFVGRGIFQGYYEHICPNRRCRKRLHIMGDGVSVQVTHVDSAPSRVDYRGQQNTSNPRVFA